MCSYSERPYTTGTTNYNLFLQTPIRDKVVCPSGSAEFHVVPIAGGGAYLDLLALSLQLIVLAALLVGAPLLYMRKMFSKKWLVAPLSAGILYGIFLLLATINHVGRELVLAIFVIAILLLATAGFFLLRHRASK